MIAVPRPATVTVVLPERIIHDVGSDGYENDCAATQVVLPPWTALDDLQLTRLLSASAPPAPGMTTDRPDDAVSRGGFEDKR